MKMRQEFNYIRKYNSDKLTYVVESYHCNKKIRVNLRELEYYKTAKPIEGLDNHKSVIVRQIIINRMVELYKETDELRVRVRFLATWEKVVSRLADLYTDQY